MSHALSPSLGQLYSVLSLYFEQQKMKILCPFFTFTATQRKGLFDTRIIKLLSLLEQSLLEFASIPPNLPPLDFFFNSVRFPCDTSLCTQNLLELVPSHQEKKTELIKIQLLYFMLCHEQWTPLLLTWVSCPFANILGTSQDNWLSCGQKKNQMFQQRLN